MKSASRSKMSRLKSVDSACTTAGSRPRHRRAQGERKQIVATGSTVGGGPGRVVLRAKDDAVGSPGEQVVDDDLVIEIQHHHRCEVVTGIGAGGRQDALGTRRLAASRSRAGDVGHHDGVTEHVGRVTALSISSSRRWTPVVRCGDLGDGSSVMRRTVSR